MQISSLLNKKNHLKLRLRHLPPYPRQLPARCLETQAISQKCPVKSNCGGDCSCSYDPALGGEGEGGGIKGTHPVWQHAVTTSTLSAISMVSEQGAGAASALVPRPHACQWAARPKCSCPGALSPCVIPLPSTARLRLQAIVAVIEQAADQQPMALHMTQERCDRRGSPDWGARPLTLSAHCPHRAALPTLWPRFCHRRPGRGTRPTPAQCRARPARPACHALPATPCPPRPACLCRRDRSMACSCLNAWAAGTTNRRTQAVAC